MKSSKCYNNRTRYNCSIIMTKMNCKAVLQPSITEYKQLLSYMIHAKAINFTKVYGCQKTRACKTKLASQSM